MAAVTPVCVQNTFRMVFSRIAAHPCDIFVAVLHQVHPLVPAADPRTEILSCTSFRHHFCLMLSLLGCIAPGQADGFLWQLFDQLRLCADDIAPEHRLFAFCHEKLAELFYIVDIQAVNAFLVCQRFRFSFSKVERFVRADVEFIRGKKRHVLLDHGLDQLDRSAAGDIHRVMLHPVPEGKRLFPAVLEFTEVAIALCGEQHVQMAERCDRRHQFDMKLCAVRIQLADFLCRKRRLIAPHLGKSGEQIRVLHIELQLVQLVVRHAVCHLF